MANLKRKEDMAVQRELSISILDKTDDGFQLVELIYERNKVVDFRLLRVNAAYEKQTGLKASEVVGKTVRQYDPRVENY